MSVLLLGRDFRRWLHWRLPFWQFPVQPATEAASEQTRFRSVINIWAFDESAHINNWIVYLFYHRAAIPLIGLFWQDFNIFPSILSWILLLSILFLLWVLHCLYHNFQCTFTCVFYVSLSRTIVYMYICIFINSSFYWKSGLATFLVLMLFVLTMYRLQIKIFLLLLLVELSVVGPLRWCDVKLLSCECHTTSPLKSQHWSR